MAAVRVEAARSVSGHIYLSPSEVLELASVSARWWGYLC